MNKKSNSLISIIVPILNEEIFLKKCLESIINQSYKKIEIILIDDGSTDESGIICDQYKNKDPRIIVVHQQNSGLSASRNLGLDICKGEYVTFVDGDDYIDKNYVKRLYNAIEKNNVPIAAGSFRYVSGDAAFGGEILPNKIFTDDLFYDINSFSCIAVNKIFKRELFNEIRFDTDFKMGEDYLLLSRILLCTKCKRLATFNNIIYYYVINPKSSTHTKLDFFKRLNNFKSREYFIKELRFYTKNKTIISKAFNNYLSNYISLYKSLKFYYFKNFFLCLFNFYHIALRNFRYLRFRIKFKILFLPFIILYKSIFEKLKNE